MSERDEILSWAIAKHDRLQDHWCDRKYLMSCSELQVIILGWNRREAEERE